MMSVGWILTSALFIVGVRESATSCLGLGTELGPRIAHAKMIGHWDEYLPDGEDELADSLARIPWARVLRPRSLVGAILLSPLPSIPGPECRGECRNCIHRRFMVGGDTLSLTEARVPEECSESPRIIWRSPGGQRHTEALLPLFGWNVEALWCTGRYLVFGLRAEWESSLIPGDALAFWELDAGQWGYAPLGERVASYSVGLALSGIFPSWPRVQVAEFGDAIVVSDQRRALTLWPELREWAIVDAATGAPVLRGAGAPPGRVIIDHPAPVPLPLLNRMRAALARIEPRVGPPEVLEMMTPACPPDSSLAAILVHAQTPQGMFGGPGEVFGVLLVDRPLTRVVATLEIFPELRSRDYTAFFVAEAASDSIIVIGRGATYGDNQVVHRFGCGVRVRTSDGH